MKMLKVTEDQFHWGMIRYTISGDSELESGTEATRLYDAFKDGYSASYDQKPVIVDGKWLATVSRLRHCD